MSKPSRCEWLPGVLVLGTIIGLGACAGLHCIPGAPRPWPDTTRGIHVFNDQLSQGLTDEQIRFAATHYAGTQKMTRPEADRLRAVNPGFLILHYRLGLGLGYRAVVNGQPTGDFLYIVEGDTWVQEWPGDAVARDEWFFPWAGSPRVLMLGWGWYLMELDNPSWRVFWRDEILRQLEANDDDGVFMDSLSVPNYLGADQYDPPLPAVDPAFEAAWARRIHDWLAWLKTQTRGRYLVPNAGSWITTRDPTDYGPADGLMIEGFAIEADQSPYAYDDWRLQMNRVLGSIRAGQAILGQTYVGGGQERMFTLGCYLLVKGRRTFLNIDVDLDVEWWPEYQIAIGSPAAAPASDVSALDPDGDDVYRRDFDNGFVLVNPTNPWDGSGATRVIPLGRTAYLAETSGGGSVPPSGETDAQVSYRAVTQVTLPPFSAAVLLDAPP